MNRRTKQTNIGKGEPEVPKPQAPQEEGFSLYKLLEVNKKAPLEEIKASYKKIALRTHPDKNPDDPSAKEKFAQLHEAYKILTDPAKRAQYDETGIANCQVGRVGDDFQLKTFEECYNYYRTIFKVVTKQDIDEFSKKYIGGQMEREDLTNFYQRQGGNMTKLLQNIPLSTNNDIERFIKYYEDEFEKGTLKLSKAFQRTKNTVKLLPEAKAPRKKAASKNKQASHEPQKAEEVEKPTGVKTAETTKKNKPKDIGKSLPKRKVQKPKPS